MFWTLLLIALAIYLITEIFIIGTVLRNRRLGRGYKRFDWAWVLYVLATLALVALCFI